MPKKLMEKKVEPIPTAHRSSWTALIKETKAVIARQDHTHFELVVLAGKVVGEYGQDKLGRWADEAHISYESAKQYRWMNSRGMDQAFIDKWCKPKTKAKALSYSVVRAISSHCGGLKSPYAVELLEWAVEHKATVIAMRGYMQELVAPMEHKEQAHAAVKIALRDKQEHEGFSDFVRVELEKIAEKRPDFEEEIMGTVITSEKDLTALKIAAGLIGEEEKKLIEQAKRALKRMKEIRRWVNQNNDQIKDSISYNHEVSQELKHMCLMLADNLNELGLTPLSEYTMPEAEQTIELEPPKLRAVR